jgi:hypothetical protein
VLRAAAIKVPRRISATEKTTNFLVFRLFICFEELMPET